MDDTIYYIIETVFVKNLAHFHLPILVGVQNRISIDVFSIDFLRKT